MIQPINSSVMRDHQTGERPPGKTVIHRGAGGSPAGETFGQAPRSPVRRVWGGSAMEILTVGPAGQIELPDNVRDRYGMTPATPIRIIETSGGVLLIPLGDAPMSPELAEELAQWEALARKVGRCSPSRKKVSRHERRGCALGRIPFAERSCSGGTSASDHRAGCSGDLAASDRPVDPIDHTTRRPSVPGHCPGWLMPIRRTAYDDLPSPWCSSSPSWTSAF